MTSQSVSKKDLILESAEKVFLEKGFYPAKIEEIAQNAGIAKGTVYIYFKDKESIYISLIEKKLKEVDSLIESISKERISCTEKLEKIYFQLCEYVDKTHKLHSFISIENIQTLMKVVNRLKSRVIPKVKRFIETIAKIVEECIVEGKLENIDPVVIALLFLSHLRLAIMLPLMKELYTLNFSIDWNSANKKILYYFFNGVCFKNSEDEK